VALRDIVAVPAIETVVQLMEAETGEPGRAQTLITSFVVTGEVERGLAQVFTRLNEKGGCGMFLKGNFGSGKSHFLAFLSLLLEGSGPPAGLAVPAAMEYFERRAAPCLPVRAALHLHPAARSLEEIVWEAVERKAQARGGGPLTLRSAPRLIEQFNRYLLPQHPEFLRRIRLDADQWRELCGKDPGKAAGKIESFMEILKEAPLKAAYDRQEVLSRIMNYIEEQGVSGLFLFVDELSEFLKSKPSPSSFNEDIRFLQFLGEAFKGRPAWVLAALQENIETAGYIEKDMVLRIKDRFPVRLGLSAKHVGELIGSRLVVKKPGADRIVKSAFQRFSAAFPGAGVTWEDFFRYYPVLPRTVGFLEGLTPLFSQHRGVVDFIVHQLTGDPNRGWPGMMDAPETALVTPDAIFDHFRERIRERPELVSYVSEIFLALERDIPRLFEDEQERRLALKAVKILVLVELSPLEKRLTAADLAPLLNDPVAETDERMNIQFLTDVILEKLVREAEYVHKESARSGLAVVYFVSREKSPHQRLRSRVKELMLQRPFSAEDCSTLAAYLTHPMLPLATIVDAGSRRYRFEWQGTAREGNVFFQKSLPGSLELAAIQQGLKSTEADFCLLIQRPDPGRDADERRAVVERLGESLGQGIAIWFPRPFEAEETALLHTFSAYHWIRQALRQERTEESKELLPLVEDWMRENEGPLKELLLEIYMRGELRSREGGRTFSATEFFPGFADLLKSIFSRMLDAMYPDHAKIMPVSLIQSYTRDRLFNIFINPGSITLEEARAQHLTRDLESVLQPLGLVRRGEERYFLQVEPEASPLIRDLLLASEGEGPTPLYPLYWGIRKGKWGLMRPYFELLLSALLATGRLAAFRGGVPVRFRALKQLSDGSVDAVGRGTLLNEPAQAAFAEFFKSHAPGLLEGSFSLSAQEGMWRGLKDLQQEIELALSETASLTKAYASYPAFKALDAASFPDRELLSEFMRSVRVSYSSLKGLEAVFESMGGKGLAALAGEIRKLRRFNLFLKTRFPEYSGYYAYFADPALERTASAERSTLGPAYAALKDRIAEAPTEYESESFGRVVEDFQGFKDTYIRYYSGKHREFFSSDVFQERRKLERAPEVQVLKKLFQVDVLRGGRDWIDFQQQLARLPVPCAKDPEAVLVSSPRCACGFMPGQPLPASLLEPLLERARAGVREVWGQLVTDLRWALDSYLHGLEATGDRPAASAIRQLLEIVPEEVERSMEDLGRLLTPETLDHINRAVSGKVLVITRSLQTLESALTGKKMNVGEMKAAFEGWLAGTESPDDAVLVHLIREQPEPFKAENYAGLRDIILEEGSRFYEAFWLSAWALRHKGLGFSAAVAEKYRFGRQAVAAVEEALTRPEIREDSRHVELFFREKGILEFLTRELCRFKERTSEELASFVLSENLLEAVSLEACRELAGRLPASDPLPRAFSSLAGLEEEGAYPHCRSLNNAVRLLGLAEKAERTRKNQQAGFYLKEGWQIEGRLGRLEADQAAIGLFSQAFLQKLAARLDDYILGVSFDREAATRTKVPRSIVLMEGLEEYLRGKMEAAALGNVVVVLIDAMRWDLWEHVKDSLAAALKSHQRTDDAALVAALPSTTEVNRPRILQAVGGAGEPVFIPAIEAPENRESIAAALKTRSRAVVLNTLLVDTLLHTATDPLPTLLDLFRTRLDSLVVPVLSAVPPDRPVIVLADHGFRRTESGQYTHGGSTLQELLVPLSLWLPR
jgi:hypothetical protein